MTGCYPRREGLDWVPEDGHVLRPISPNGLHPNEVTIAEILKKPATQPPVLANVIWAINRSFCPPDRALIISLAYLQRRYDPRPRPTHRRAAAWQPMATVAVDGK